MDYIPGGELFNYIRKSGLLSQHVTRFFAAEIVLAIEYMHSKYFVYRDLKPENVLLDEQGHVKLIDFGFCKRVRERYSSRILIQKFMIELERFPQLEPQSIWHQKCSIQKDMID